MEMSLQSLLKLAKRLLGKKQVDAFKKLTIKINDIHNIIREDFEDAESRYYALASCAYALLFFPALQILKDEADWQRYMDDIFKVFRQVASYHRAMLRKPKGVVEMRKTLSIWEATEELDIIRKLLKEAAIRMLPLASKDKRLNRKLVIARRKTVEALSIMNELRNTLRPRFEEGRSRKRLFVKSAELHKCSAK